MEETKDINETAEEVKTSEKKKKKHAELDALKEEIEALKTEAKEKDDKYLRLAAEYDNFRRRSREEKDATYSSAMADTVAELLPIIDNLERAVGVEGADAVAKGLEMTLKGAAEALEKMGVEAFGVEGDQFDPNMHNAMMMVDDDNHSEGQIVTVFQKGYKKGDRVIRYAMVTVAN